MKNKSKKHTNTVENVQSKTGTAHLQGKKSKRISSAMLRQQQRQEYINSDKYKILQLAQKQIAVKKWYKLDNSALMYPIIASSESNSVFRVGVQLKSPVDPIALQKAINEVFTRYPTITGTIRKGIFWPYIDKPSIPVIATKVTTLPCKPMPLNGKQPLVRVQYNGHEIACEVFHSATDGTGGLEFLNTLLLAYFDIIGNTIDSTTLVRHYKDLPTIAELTDHTPTVAVKKNPPPLPKAVKACNLIGTPLPKGTLMTHRGICDSTKLYDIAKQYGGTVTELLGAIQLLALAEHNRKTNNSNKRPIRILVAVNLRKIFNLDTLRNFTSYIFYQYNGQEDIQEIVNDLRQQTAQQLNKEYFTAMLSYNYNSGNNVLLKIVPMAIKRIAMNLVMTQLGEGNINTSTLSNLGVIKAPPQYQDLIDRYDFQLGRAPKNVIYFGVATYNNRCVISISSSIFETTIEQYYFSKLASLGIDVAIESDIVEGLE